MGKTFKLSAAASSLALLAACSGAQPPGYTDLFGHWAEAGPAASTMKSARATKPSGDAFAAAYYKYSMEHAEFEYVQMEDYRDAMLHANNATSGKPEPSTIESRKLPGDKVAELTSARNRLVTALSRGGAQVDADSAGKAVARFNCWMEQQEENFQPKDIAYCKDQFLAAVAKIEKVEAAAGSAEMITLQSDVLFDLGKDVIKPGFFPALDKVADMMVKDTNLRVQVAGHTDTLASAKYNQGLSERRAKAVAAYLTRKGVSADRMTVQGFGETRLAVPTKDNVNEPRNRRVELRQR